LPFSFKLPNDIPGTFKMQNQGDASKRPTQICYQVEAFIGNPETEEGAEIRQHMCKIHEFEVREFLFTSDEIE